MTRRWEQCVTHHADEAKEFIAEYFSTSKKRVLVLASAGFDVRSAAVSKALAETKVQRRAIFIREERPDADPELRRRADANAEQLAKLIPDSEVIHIDIFDPTDQAVIGAKRLVLAIKDKILTDLNPTDIVIDVSALSIGISFPMVRLIYDMCAGKPDAPNVHLFVTEDPNLDTAVMPEHTGQAMFVPGFEGEAALDGQSSATRLWIPQLVAGRQEALRRIHDFVSPRETCPILPFPAKDLRRADSLIKDFATLLSSTWDVDPRSYIYAHEQEPVDLYRTLLRLADAREKVYREHGGSLLILSPVGSKLLALGALLAALERNFPVAYLETVRYSVPPSSPPNLDSNDWPIVHLWLSGIPYQ